MLGLYFVLLHLDMVYSRGRIGFFQESYEKESVVAVKTQFHVVNK